MLKAKKIISKIILSCLIFILLTFSFVPYAHAQEGGSWYNQSFQEWYSKVYDSSNPSEIFGERYTAAQVEWIFYSLFAFVINKTTDPETTACLMAGDLNDCVDRLKNLFSFNSSQPSENRGLASLIFQDRPFSGITYFKERARTLKLIPEAKAQEGFGFTQALFPVQDMWRASRDIAYALLVVAIVILSFMIMFRVKIDPQTVITVQSALPKVAIALVLITFSYAIAGLLVDLMYVVIGLVSLLGVRFFPFPIPGGTGTIYNFLTLGQPFNVNIQLGILPLFFTYIILFVIAFLASGLVYIGAIQAAAVTLISVGLASLFSMTGIGGFVLMLFLVIALFIFLWYLVKVFWTLLKAFAWVLLLTIFAPFYIIIGVVVPGLGFNTWLRSFISNLSVFVVAGTLFLLSYVLLTQAWVISGKNLEGASGTVLNFLFGTRAVESVGGAIQGGTNAGWPPLLGLGGAGAPLLLLGVSFVIFTLIPQTADIIKSVIERKPFAYGFGAAVRAGYELTGIPAYQKYVGERRAAVTVEKLRTGLKRTKIPQWLQDMLAP